MSRSSDKLTADFFSIFSHEINRSNDREDPGARTADRKDNEFNQRVRFNPIARLYLSSTVRSDLRNKLCSFVFTTIEPYMGPILKSATGGLAQIGDEVLKDPNQYAVFTDPAATDPTHSFLSKDHFGLICKLTALRIF